MSFTFLGATNIDVMSTWSLNLFATKESREFRISMRFGWSDQKNNYNEGII